MLEQESINKRGKRRKEEEDEVEEDEVDEDEDERVKGGSSSSGGRAEEKKAGESDWGSRKYELATHLATSPRIDVQGTRTISVKIYRLYSFP